jgi:hypothetical protein
VRGPWGLLPQGDQLVIEDHMRAGLVEFEKDWT